MDDRAVLEQLAAALRPIQASQEARQFGVSYKHTASGTPITVGYSHGPGGNFSFPGVDPAVFHTAVGNMGILGQLPAKPSVFTNPVYQVLTGVQDLTGTEKADVCADARVAGLKKSCMQTSVFGRYELSTSELELNRLGKYNDLADPMDLTLIGSPIHQAGIFAAGARSPATPADLLENEFKQKMWELNVAMHRLLSQQLWIGSPANNPAGGGYMELTSFSVLVNTGHVDAQNNTSCPSLDSDLKDMNCASIDVLANQQTLIAMLSSLLRTRMDLAFRTGVAPVRFVLAMRPELFWEITAIWACAYFSDRCALPAQAEIVIQSKDAVQFRDDMRAGRYLLIDGQRIQVVLDDGIPVLTPTTSSKVAEGCQCSDIYLIPMSIVGGRAVTYLEYFDYANPSIAAAMANMVLGRVEGAFLTWPRQDNQCVVWQTKVEPRLVLRTPWLAGRIQNVEYCPPQQARTPFPDDPYFVDGGLTERPGPSYYALWQS